MKHNVPTTSSGIAIHHAAGQLEAERARPPRPRKIAICTRAMPIVTTTRAHHDGARGDRGELEPPQQLALSPALQRRRRTEGRAHRHRPAEQSRRDELDRLQRVVLDPLGAEVERRWAGPEAATLAPSTNARSVPCVTAAWTWSVWV